MIQTLVTIILLLLKVIGWILLGLLALILLFLLTVLLAPVHYRATVRREDMADAAKTAWKDGFFAELHITWLLCLIHFTLQYEADGLTQKIRVAGIDVMRLGAWMRARRQKRAQRAADRRRAKEDAKEHTMRKAPTQTAQHATQNTAAQTEPAVKDVPPESASQLSDADLQQSTSSAEETAQKTEPDGCLQTKKTDSKKKRGGRPSFFQKISALPGHLRTRAASMQAHMQGAKKKLAGFQMQFTDESNRNAVLHAWRELCYLLSHYGPRRLRADAVFSLADPALTGKALGLLSLFPVIYRYPCKLVPDFSSDTMYMTGQLYVAGRVRALHVPVILVRLYADRDVRRLIQKVRGKNKTTLQLH